MSITSLFHRHVLPAFGTRGLASLRRGEIETWAARLPLSARTTAQATRYLSTMLEAAVVDGLIATHPAHRARRPRVEQDPVVPFTDTEVEALRAAAPCGFAVALDLGLGAGLRQSEATGLSVDRIDFLRRELTVDRQLVTRKAGEPTFGPPKSKRSYRRVPLADAVVSALARHVEVHGDGRDGLVLHGLDGRPCAASASASCGASSGPEPTCLPPGSTTPATPFASTLLSGGVSVAAAEYLGHSPGALLATYAHLLPADHERARSAVAAAFSEAGSSRVTAVSGS
jgi:integrase